MSRVQKFKSAVLVLTLVYAGFAEHYYYTQRHPFDPFTQMPLSRLRSPMAKPSRSLRVLALGGSTTECASLAEPQRYPEVVGQLLSRAYPERKIEVFNAGRDWATTRHSLIAYSTYYQDWKPDLVLILEGINDLYRSFSPPAYALGEYDALYSHFYGASAQGAKPPTFEQYLFEWWRGPIAGEFWYEAPFVKRREVNYPLDRYYSLPSFEANLVKLVHAVRSTGAQPVLITQASLLKPVMTDEERKALWFGEAFCTTRVGFARYESPSPASLGEGLAGFNAAMRRVAQNEAVQLVNADSEIQKSLAMFEDDCHYTAAGAQRLAEVVANAIKSGALIQ